MKKSKIKIIYFIILIGVILGIATNSKADVGSFDRYDSGSSSSSDWSSSDWGSSSWDSDWDSDYSSGSLGGFIFLGDNAWIGLIILAAIVIYSIKKRKNRRPSMPRHIPRRPVDYQNGVSPEDSKKWAAQIRQIDPNFSEEKMTAWSKDLFVKLQNAWTDRDWEPMRPYETEALFEQHAAQVQGYIDTNRINVVDRISVQFAYLYSFRQDGEKDILEIALRAIMKDYIIDATTKEVLEGNKTEDRNNLYKLTFERKKGTLTPEGDIEVKTTNCPNCGAPTQITSSGKCEYCGSVITTDDYGWVLANLEPLKRY